MILARSPASAQPPVLPSHCPAARGKLCTFRHEEAVITGDRQLGEERRLRWERQWERTKDEDFEWSLAHEVAPQLRDLVDEGGLAPGPALDLGCGAGVATRFLADRFRPSVGIDIAFHAVAQAVARRGHDQATYACADASALPFPDQAFSFLFDRGCLQNLAEHAWRSYFEEARRVLRPGGTLLLLVSKMVPEFPPLLSGQGARLRWSWYVKRRRSGPQFLTHDFLRSVAPLSLTIGRIEDFTFVTKKGKARRFTHAVFENG